ncbi:hypothetical protein KJ855_01460 [Patescibacteria group bacterium]|nr:hypothetical protein [Patescibacteria group bacterium]
MGEFKILKQKTYLAMIENSVGSQMFAELWAKDEKGETKDVTNGGELSCAVFVTGLLKLNDMLSNQSATVEGAVKLMEKEGWKSVELDNIREGDILVWERKKTGYTHAHIGFYVGDKKAVSNNWKLRRIVRHGWDYGGRRRIIKVLRWGNGMNN